jgi:hypothetical protein
VERTPWHERSDNARLVSELREALSTGADLLVFLGAGLSYGVGRGRAAFEVHEFDDGYRFPSWPALVRRMHARLRDLPEFEPFGESLETFFAEQPAIDSAQLFRDKVGTANHIAFLKEQFQTHPTDTGRLTRSHHELVRLPLRIMFTTNYDELIELAFSGSGQSLRVSVTPSEFMAHRQERPERHLVKLHGSIDQPASIVLTREDYARSRRDRADIFRFLGNELRYSRFLLWASA